MTDFKYVHKVKSRSKWKCVTLQKVNWSLQMNTFLFTFMKNVPSHITVE